MRLLIAAAALLAFALPLHAGTISELTGTFQGIEQGDYFYFKLRTDAGADESLMIIQTDATMDEFVDHADQLVGTRVKVRIEDRKQDIPEAGGEIDVRVLLVVEKLAK